MIRLLSTTVLLLVSFSAFAGWTELAADDVATEYVNFDTIQRDGNVVTMWNMSDFKEQQEVGNGRLYQSSKAQQEYDCFANTKRLLTLIHYGNPMGKGNVAFLDNTSGEWRKIRAGSLGEVHLKAACLANIATP